MTYLEGLKQILTETTLAGDGAVWGATSPEGATDMQGDFYAPGNAMYLYGDPKEPRNSKKKKKKKASYKVYKRAFVESLGSTEAPILDCVIVTVDDNVQFVQRLLESRDIDFGFDGESFYFTEAEDDILETIQQLEDVLGSSNFEEQFFVCIGELDLPLVERVSETPKCRSPYSKDNIDKGRKAGEGVGTVKHSKNRTTLTSKTLFTNRQNKRRNKI